MYENSDTKIRNVVVTEAGKLTNDFFSNSQTLCITVLLLLFKKEEEGGLREK